MILPNLKVVTILESAHSNWPPVLSVITTLQLVENEAYVDQAVAVCMVDTIDLSEAVTKGLKRFDEKYLQLQSYWSEMEI